MSRNFYFKLLYIILIFSNSEGYFNPTVDHYNVTNTSVGAIRGRDLVFEEGNITEYLGVPFAYPPMNKSRFLPPVELQKPTWNDTRNASLPATSCMQYIINYNFSGLDDFNPKNLLREDCLELNMWVPYNSSGSVIVFIFGGSYNFGSASVDLFNGSILASKTQAIVVNLNYRLGIFGFGYLGEDSKVKGNMGFLDQQVGLKWVYNNIEYFGGNKSKITLFGESAGSASVTAHLLSEGSRPYFSNVIACSGVITNLWATVTREVAENNTLTVASRLNCTRDNKTELLECLQKVNETKLLLASLNVSHPKQIPLPVSFFPIDNDTVFFNGSVLEKITKNMTKKDADMLIGRTADEATYFMPLLLDKFGCTFNSSIDPNSRENRCLLNETVFLGVVNMVSEIIGFNENEMRSLNLTYSQVRTNKTRGKIAELLSDLLFDCSVATFAENYYNVTHRNVYFYEFRKRSPVNPWPKWMGAMHGWELEYIFGYSFRYPKIYEDLGEGVLEKEQNFSSKLIGYIKKFVDSGSLDDPWRKFNDTVKKALVLNETFPDPPTEEKYVNAFSRLCRNLTSIFKTFENRKIREFIESQMAKSN